MFYIQLRYFEENTVIGLQLIPEKLSNHVKEDFLKE